MIEIGISGFGQPNKSSREKPIDEATRLAAERFREMFTDSMFPKKQRRERNDTTRETFMKVFLRNLNF